MIWNVTIPDNTLRYGKLVSLILVLSAFLNNKDVFAQDTTEPENLITSEESISPLRPADRPLRFYLVDIPLTFKDGIYYPSWQQSIHLTKNIHQTADQLIARALEPVHPFWGKVLTTTGILGFNVLHAFAPTGLGWQHQEAHRAILRANGISSENESYNKVCNFCNSVHRRSPFFSMRLATFNVNDQDLIDFKANNYADFNRNRGAGHEGQLEMITGLKKDAFYYGTPLYRDLVPMWLNTYVVISFLSEYKQSDYDEKIDIRNFDEPLIEERDITGVEFTAWVYDLFLPDEPYDLRGIDGGLHPYHDGVDRYIGNEDLTTEMRDYLEQQSRLAYLNLLSPQLFGLNRIKIINPFNKRPMYWNFNVTHNVNSFGHNVDVNFFIQQGKYNWFFTYHNYKNQNNYFPGIGAELIRYPLKKGFFSGGIDLWIQPENQRFQDTKGAFGGGIKAGIDMPVSEWLEWSLATDIKTKGTWYGVPTTDSYFQIRGGMNVHF